MHGDKVIAYAEVTTLYHGNQQYSVTAISNSSGNVSERYAYTAYGQPTFLNASGAVQTSSAASNRYTFTGREWDSTLGLHHFRARWVSGLSGRFLGRDPIGFMGGSISIVEYCHSNPFVYVDPSGKQIRPLPAFPWYPYPYPTSPLPPTTPKPEVDPRPHKWWIPYSSYNCAGYALRTYENEGDKKELLKKLSPYESPCDKDCKCGETKCRVWDFVVRWYDAKSGKLVLQLKADFHMVCSQIPKNGNNTTGPEPLCYEKNGDGPVTGPIDPSTGEPGPEDVPNVPKTLVVKLEDMKQTCYCLPAGGIK
jgi:RHS repeat-associated protein